MLVDIQIIDDRKGVTKEHKTKRERKNGTST